MSKKLNSVRLAVVNVKNYNGEFVESFMYVNGKKTNWDQFEVEQFAETMPTEGINEIYVDELMPKNEKDFS
jgi:hypothetical protein